MLQTAFHYNHTEKVFSRDGKCSPEKPASRPPHGHRSAYTTAQRAAENFPSELEVVWEPLSEDEAPGVESVIDLAERLEDRLRAGEKVHT